MDSKSNSFTLHRRTPPSDLILPKLSSFLPQSAVSDTTSSSSDSSSSPLLSFPSVDVELISLDSQSYTSLRDILLPTTSVVNSPTTSVPPSSAAQYEIPIRNRLVKQAAWAYLQPMAASPSSSTRPFFHCLMAGHYFLPPVNALCRLFNCGLIPLLTRAFNQLLIHLRIRTSCRHYYWSHKNT